MACRHLPLGEAHDFVDHIAQEIAATMPGAHVVVHAEPAVDCADPSRCVHQARHTNLLAHQPETQDARRGALSPADRGCIARLWCVARSAAKLVLAYPRGTSYAPGRGRLRRARGPTCCVRLLGRRGGVRDGRNLGRVAPPPRRATRPTEYVRALWTAAPFWSNGIAVVVLLVYFLFLGSVKLSGDVFTHRSWPMPPLSRTAGVDVIVIPASVFELERTRLIAAFEREWRDAKVILVKTVEGSGDVKGSAGFDFAENPSKSASKAVEDGANKLLDALFASDEIKRLTDR